MTFDLMKSKIVNYMKKNPSKFVKHVNFPSWNEIKASYKLKTEDKKMFDKVKANWRYNVLRFRIK